MSIKNIGHDIITYIVIMADSIIIIPLNTDFLLYQLSLQKKRYWHVEYVLFSVLGCIISYGIFSISDVDLIDLAVRTGRFFLNVDLTKRIIYLVHCFEKYPTLTLLFKPLIPILPFGLINLACASIKMNIWKFIALSTISRLFKLVCMHYYKYILGFRIIDTALNCAVCIAVANLFFKIVAF